MYVYIYIYIEREREIRLSLSIYIYIYVYVYFSLSTASHSSPRRPCRARRSGRAPRGRTRDVHAAYYIIYSSIESYKPLNI